MRHLENCLNISFCLFSERGHADRHGGRHEGGRGPGPPDALHLRQCGPPLHAGEGNAGYIIVIICVVMVLFFTAQT